MIPEAWRQGEVAVVGLGRSGLAASKWLASHGLSVYASDGARTPALEAAVRQLPSGITVELGRHDLVRIGRARAAIVSPGVPPDAPPIAAARAAGLEIVSELDLGARALGDASLIVVTGTNGKTTTTRCVAHLLSAAGVPSIAAGNIGRPLTDLVDDPQRPTWIAVEVSSFQLHDSPHLVPAVGVLTNLAPDHLDRYPTVEAYYGDKRLLFRNASDASVWVLNGDDPAVGALARGVRGRHLRFSVRGRADAWLDRSSDRLMLTDAVLAPRSSLQLLGDHNVENVLAAALAVTAAGVIPAALVNGIETFRPPAHRLETVRTVASVTWINDSKATNVAAAAVALRAMDRPYVLIAGGHPKGESLAPLVPLLGRCVRVIAYGEAAAQLLTQLGSTGLVESVERFDDAVSRAATVAPRGGAVLLSPACASFDQFTNFEERGDRFRALVESL